MSMVKCPECGHDVSSKAKSCPQCGCSFVSPHQNSALGETLSIISFATGLLSWFMSLWGLIGVTAVVTGFVSSTKTGYNRTYALTGIISGILNLVYVFIVTIIASL